ncbi:MAG: hypothetical protein QOJ29_2809, partial [Thermoleophilaceae bacterium]|nr:hypothetical protein [Thermoleophilaceae bacterium]
MCGICPMRTPRRRRPYDEQGSHMLTGDDLSERCRATEKPP